MTTKTNHPRIQPGYCQCGCGQLARIAKRNYPHLGTRKGEPLRFAVGHRGELRISYVVDQRTGCWNWARGVNDNGYGIVRWGGRGQRAHRVVYTLARGPIPDGMDLDHRCRNRRCVNPKHMRVTTRAGNVRAGLVTKLTPGDVRNIRELAANGITEKVLARQFGVGNTTIHSVISRRTWKDI